MIWLFFGWERRLEAPGAEPLVGPSMLGNQQLAGGLTDVLLPVPGADGAVLRGPAVPVGRRSACPRSRPAALLPMSLRCWPPPSGSRGSCRTSGPRRVVQLACSRFAGISPPGGASYASAAPTPVTFPYRSPAWHRRGASQLRPGRDLRGPDEQSREVWRPAEHRDQPRRLHRHRARRLDLDRGPDHLVPAGDRAEPGRAGLGEVPDERAAGGGGAVRVRRGPRGGGQRVGSRRDRRSARRCRIGRPRPTGCGRPCRPRVDRVPRTVSARASRPPPPRPRPAAGGA